MYRIIYTIKEILFTVFSSAVISFVAASTRGNGESVVKKTLIGTLVGTLVISIIKIFFIH